MNITTDNNNSHHRNLSITNCTVESPKVLINEPSSPFHQTKAFNPFNFHDNYSITKPLSSKSYYSQIVDYKLLQTLPNGRMSPNTSSYSFHSKSLYSPQMHSQSPKQYENVLSPTFQPSNKLTVVETTKQPVVEVKKAKSTKSKSKSENKSKKSIKIDLLKETVISLSPPTQSTNNNNTSKSTDTVKPKQLKAKAKSKSKKKISSSSSPSITSCVDNINSRIVYPNLDLSSIFNDDDFYDSSLVCFSLKDTMNKMYIKNLRILKPNLTPNVDSDELISLKDILLPSEVIKDIQLPKRKLELSSVVLIGDSDSENEESKDRKSVV